MKKQVLFLFETTDLASQPFRDKGYQTISIDILNQELYSEDAIKLNWDISKREDDIVALCENAVLVVGFPPCTDLATSGAAHFKRKREKDPLFQEKALDLFLSVERIANKLSKKQGHPIPWMAENPISVVSTLYRRPNFKFNPHEYGGWLPEDDVHPLYSEYYPPRDRYAKLTCIWSGNGFKQPVKNNLTPIPGYSIGTQLGGRWAKTKKIRSASPRGFFIAMAEDY